MVLVRRKSATGHDRESYHHRDRALTTIERKEVDRLKKDVVQGIEGRLEDIIF